jgi:hypothetical protein
MNGIRKGSLIAAVFTLCACAAAQTASPSCSPEGRWQGVVVRGDYRQTVVVDLEKADSGWAGTLTAGDLSRPLEHVRFSGDSIHFDTEDDLAFDGRIEGESMVGFLSGPVTASLALSRDTTDPYSLTSRLEARRPVLVFGRPW